MSKKQIDSFIVGTQYYRAPTPLPSEWDSDLGQMAELGLDAVQIRVQWRWNEPREGQYEFADVDRLFDLAEKHGRKVIFKFMMETAPDYVFHKYGGERKDLRGLPISAGGHGAYYVGGWWPCFENPDVMRKALEFVRVFTARYKGRESLILWNIWNEPRSRPVGDCCCGHSTAAYRAWLGERYGTIEKLNDFFGKKWEDFETVSPPGMPYDYAELFLWRKWAMSAVARRLAAMRAAVSGLDDSRPIIAHVGTCSALQDAAGDGSDDLQNNESSDFYGTSYCVANEFRNIMDEARPFMLCDWIRSVSEYFWVYELYPDWGAWCKPVTLDDFRLKVWSAPASGAKGLVYWQYRAERLGNEDNLSGLVNIDGSFKPVSLESARIAAFIKEHEKFLSKAKVKDDGIAIVYSQDSDLINRVENTGNGEFNNFDLRDGMPYLYKKACWGAYALFRELGHTVKWLDSRRLDSKSLTGIRLLYLPEAFMLSEKEIGVIEKFAAAGGAVIAEEGAGLRAENTWLNPSWPNERLATLFGVKISCRTSVKRGAGPDSLSVGGHKIPAGEFISKLAPAGSEIIGVWDDGSSGAVKKGSAVFIGTSLGASFYDNYRTAYSGCAESLRRILESLGVFPERAPRTGVYVRELRHDGQRMLFIFNRSSSPELFSDSGLSVTVPPKSAAVLVIPPPR